MRITSYLAVLVGSLVLAGGNSAQGAFSTGYSGGGSWNTVFAQGFSPSLSPSPNPGLLPGHQVGLNSFSFYKSGNADSASDIQLAIIDNIFADIYGMSTSSSFFVGLSDNTIGNTSDLATGDAITFTFSSLPLSYGGNYAAVLVNVGGGGSLTPVLVSALTANYAETPPGSGIYIPTSNYGTDSEYIYATSNFISVQNPLPPPPEHYFNTFSYAGDANFLATFNVIPEPATLTLGLASLGLVALARRRRAS